MKNITPELIAKAKAAKSAEELLALAKENGIEMTEEEAKTYFAQLGTSGAVADDDLDAVSGGYDCIEDLMNIWNNREGIKNAVGTLSEGSSVHGVETSMKNNTNDQF